MSDDIDNLSRERDNAAKLAELSLKEIYKLKKEVAKLKAENAALRSELSAYKEGIPVEDADERQAYLFLHENGSLHKARFDCDEGGICCWFIGNPNHGFIFLEPSDRLYPLPQEKEDR